MKNSKSIARIAAAIDSAIQENLSTRKSKLGHQPLSYFQVHATQGSMYGRRERETISGMAFCKALLGIRYLVKVGAIRLSVCVIYAGGEVVKGRLIEVRPVRGRYGSTQLVLHTNKGVEHIINPNPKSSPAIRCIYSF